jgi:hypothetical protein
LILLKCAQGIINKVASNDHNWHFPDYSQIELTGGKERRPCENYFAAFNYALLCGCHKGLA